MKNLRTQLALIFALLTSLMGGHLHAAEPSQAILVLDASGSMWGTIKGEAKIHIARSTVAQILEGIDPNLHLGLMAYGHRKRGDCDDIELLIPPGPVDQKAYTEAVNALIPRGRTPLAKAISLAADSLKNSEQKATVILVSDGLETCGGDPCATAEELKKLGMDFTAHVVGFNLADDEQKAIRCIAEATGGQFLSANDAPSLLNALATVVTKTVDPAAAPPELKPAPAEEAPPEAPAQDVTESKVTFKTLLSEGGQEVKSYYYIFSDQDGGDKVANGGGPSFKLAPGRYRVQAKWGDSQIEEAVTVPSQPEAEIVLVYNAGILRLRTLASEGGEAVKVYYTISRAGQNLEGHRPRITSGGKKEFKLLAGEYHAHAQWGDASAEAFFEVTPGELTEGNIILNAGVLNLDASPTEDGEKVKAYYTVLSSNSKLDGSRKKFASGAGGKFQLPAGKYLIRGKWGEVQGETEVEIKPGEMSKATVVVPGGVLRVMAKDAEGETIEPYTSISKAKATLEGKHPRVATGRGQFIIPAGDYLIEAKVGDQSVQSKATVTVGEVTEVTLDTPASEE